jgi:all-trans-retinol 13,14-reductase
MHAMVAKHYMKGGSYPIGGAGQICASMLPTIRKGGGEVYIRAGVEQILFKNNRAIGVKMEDEKEFFAPVIISGVGYFNTYKMIPNWISQKIKWKKNNLKMKRSLSHMSLYIGLKGTTKNLGLKRANYWIYPDDYDHDLSMSKFLDNPEKESFALTYISFPSAKDPTWQERYPEKSTIEVITFAPYEWFNKWEQKEWKKRGEEYDNLKEKYSQRLLQQLYRVEPQLEGKIDHYELSTPLSTSHFVNYDKGEIYGLSHDPIRFKNKFLKPRTNLKNLFLTGQDIATAGVSGALVGGILTASTILNRNVIKEIVSK